MFLQTFSCVLSVDFVAVAFVYVFTGFVAVAFAVDVAVACKLCCFCSF